MVHRHSARFSYASYLNITPPEMVKVYGNGRIRASPSSMVTNTEYTSWSYHKRFAEGQYCIGSNQMLGYDLDKGKGKLVPNKDAWIIRLIFRRLVEGATFQSIINELTEKKVTRMRSKAAWNVSSLLGILRNETYVGDKLLQKKPPLNFLTKRPDLTLDYDSYYLENDHEAIIDRETWEKAQERLDQCRQEKENGVHRRRADHHVFYGKLFCGECGGTYKRRTFSVKEADGVRHYHAWNCRERQKGKNGNGCKNITLQEKVLEDMITAEMGWSEFNDERFETEIQRVEVTPSGIRVLRKVA